jgi:hypothetical protein
MPFTDEPMLQRNAQDSELRRLHKVKQKVVPPLEALGPELLNFFKQNIQKRQTKLGMISEAWAQLIPDLLQDHCCLDGFSAGTLRVVVDSSSHLYELKQLLLSGLQKQLLIACKSAGLKKINLKPGRWYHGDGRDRKITF